MRNALKVLLVVAFAIPTMASAGISNTKHNLSSTGPGSVHFSDTGVDMCRFCHMPHNADTSRGTLWARAAPTGTAFTSPTATSDGTPLLATNGALGVASQKCLSCHDGTVALNTTVNKFGAINIVASSIAGGNTSNVGGNIFLRGTMQYADLNGQHPVGIPFAHTAGSAAVNAQYGSPSLSGCLDGATMCVTGASGGGAYLKLFGTAVTDARLECGSCHEPHKENVGNLNAFFLRVPSNVANGRCGGCHIK